MFGPIHRSVPIFSQTYWIIIKKKKKTGLLARPDELLFRLLQQQPELSLVLSDLGRLANSTDLTLEPWFQEHCRHYGPFPCPDLQSYSLARSSIWLFVREQRQGSCFNRNSIGFLLRFIQPLITGVQSGPCFLCLSTIKPVYCSFLRGNDLHSPRLRFSARGQVVLRGGNAARVPSGSVLQTVEPLLAGIQREAKKNPEANQFGGFPILRNTLRVLQCLSFAGIYLPVLGVKQTNSAMIGDISCMANKYGGLQIYLTSIFSQPELSGL